MTHKNFKNQLQKILKSYLAFSCRIDMLWTLFVCLLKDLGWENCWPQIWQLYFCPMWMRRSCADFCSRYLNLASQCLQLNGNSPRCSTVIKIISIYLWKQSNSAHPSHQPRMAERFAKKRKLTPKIIICPDLGLMFFLSLANRSAIRSSKSDAWDETIGIIS